MSWTTQRVKRVASKIGSGKTPTGGALAYQETGVLFLRSQNVRGHRLDLSDVAFISPQEDQAMSGSRVHAGDSLLNITGASLGRVAIAPNDLGKANVNQHVCIVRPNGEIDPRFLMWSLAGESVQSQIFGLQVGGNRDGMNFEQVGDLKLHVPVLDEQRHIADFLDAETSRIDRMLALQMQLVARLDERNQALRDGLIDLAANIHGEIPLRRFVTRIEQGVSPQCENSPSEAGAWGVLKLNSVKRGNFAPDENKALPHHEIPARAFEIRDGDLLVTRANTPSLVGDVAVVSGSPRRLLLPDLIYRVGLTTAIDARFVVHVALASRTRLLIEATARGSSQSMVKLRGDDIREWPVPAIDVEHQRRLVESIEAASRKSEALSAAIKTKQQLLAERRQALITAAVTGQIDVTTARGADVS